ncbi:MAG: hypothetical protein SOX43_07050 [Pelistega sp.]|nr:hypothetical protein [Pelistega sp.]
MIPQIELLQTKFYTLEAVFLKSEHLLDYIALSRKKRLHKVQTESSFPYTFKVDNSLKLKKGQFVVAHTNSGLKVVLITKIHKKPQINTQAGFTYKWVLSKIKTKRFVKRMKEEKKIASIYQQLEYLEKSTQLKNKIEKMLLLTKPYNGKFH